MPSLVTTLLTNIAGGSAALALDAVKPDWAYKVPGTAGAAVPTPMNQDGSIKIQPGAIAGVLAVVGLALMPGPSKGWKEVAATAATGALVAEGTLLASTTVVPMVVNAFGPKTNPLMMGVYGMPRGLPGFNQQVGVTDQELQAALGSYRGYPRAA